LYARLGLTAAQTLILAGARKWVTVSIQHTMEDESTCDA
jgi:hypothetical protein